MIWISLSLVIVSALYKILVIDFVNREQQQFLEWKNRIGLIEEKKKTKDYSKLITRIILTVIGLALLFITYVITSNYIQNK